MCQAVKDKEGHQSINPAAIPSTCHGHWTTAHSIHNPWQMANKKPLRISRHCSVWCRILRRMDKAIRTELLLKSKKDTELEFGPAKRRHLSVFVLRRCWKMRSKGRRLRTPKRQLVWGSGYAPGTVLRIVSFFVCLQLCLLVCFACLFASLFRSAFLLFLFHSSLFLCIQTSSVTTDVARVKQLLALKCTKSQEQFQRLNHHVHPGNMEPENTPLEFRKFIFQTCIFRFYVNLRGCQYLINNCITNYTTKLMTMVNVCLELRGCHRARSRSFLPKCMGTNIWTLELQLGV